MLLVVEEYAALGSYFAQDDDQGIGIEHSLQIVGDYLRRLELLQF